MALDLCTKCVSPKCLPNKWLHFEKILLVLSKFKMHTKNERSGGVSWYIKLLFLSQLCSLENNQKCLLGLNIINST